MRMFLNALALVSGTLVGLQPCAAQPPFVVVDTGQIRCRSPDTTGSAAIDPIFSATPIVNEGGVTDYGASCGACAAARPSRGLPGRSWRWTTRSGNRDGRGPAVPAAEPVHGGRHARDGNPRTHGRPSPRASVPTA